jgi:inosine/xanthosine triphosphate pyrophosphatase family protein
MNLKLIKEMRLVAATHNAGKAVEIGTLLGGHYTVVTAAGLNVPEPDEKMVSVSELPAPFRKMALRRISRPATRRTLPTPNRPRRCPLAACLVKVRYPAGSQ